MSVEKLKRSPEKNTSIEEQFRRRERVRIGGGITDIVRVKPRRAEATPLLFAPGCQRTIDSYEGAIKELAIMHSREVISFNHPHLREVDRSEEREQSDRDKRMTHKARDILDVLEHEHIRKVDVIAHSAGAVDAIIAAQLHPEKFRNIVLYAPAGFTDEGRTTEDQMTGALEHAATHAPQTVHAFQQMIVNTFNMYLNFASDPGGTLQEQHDIAHTKIWPDMLRNLREMGIGIVIVCPVHDTIFPVEETIKHVQGDSVDGFLTVRGSHTDIETDPAHVAVVASVLETLQANKGKRSHSAKDATMEAA